MKRTRRALSLLGALLGSMFIVVTGPAASACGCGGFIDQAIMQVSQETAVIVWDGSREDIVMQLTALSDSTESALLMPTPAPAQVKLGDPAVFDELHTVSKPRTEFRHEWWASNTLPDDLMVPYATAQAGSVQVFGVVNLGPLEVTSLASDVPAALDAYLATNGYQISDALAPAVDSYIQDGWSFLAIKLTAQGQSLSGNLAPLHISFASDELIYPLKMSQAAQGPIGVRLYVLSSHRMASSHGGQVLFAGPVTNVGPATTALVGDSAYLTTIAHNYYDPGAEIADDIHLMQASTDDPYQRVTYVTKYVTILGLPAGWVLTALVAIAVSTVLAVVAVANRRRAAARTAAHQQALQAQLEYPPRPPQPAPHPHAAFLPPAQRQALQSAQQQGLHAAARW